MRKLYIFTSVFLLVGVSLFAQPSGGGENGGGPGNAPIDAGVLSLIIAGVFYGFRKKIKE